MLVNNKVFIVSGAGSGIGQALTLQLVRMGAKVAMIDGTPILATNRPLI